MRPFFKELLRHSDPWEHFGAHDTVPNDPAITSKIGFKSGEKVLGVASYAGTWLKTFQDQGVKVTYSDLSKTQVKDERQRRRFQQVRRANATLVPQIAEAYDWTFSFEPYPLIGFGFPLTAIRSLLNKKGMKIASGERSYDDNVFGFPIEEIGKIYGAKTVSRTPIISDYNGEAVKVRIDELYTNDAARRKAQIDLRMMRIAEKKDKISTTHPSLRLLKVSQKEIEDSLNRLARLNRSLRLWM